MGVAKDSTRSPEDVISTPLPGETLAMFYARSRTFSAVSCILCADAAAVGEYWAGKATESSDNRGKQLRRDGFTLAQERYGMSLSFNRSKRKPDRRAQRNINRSWMRWRRFWRKPGWMKKRCGRALLLAHKVQPGRAEIVDNFVKLGR